MLCAKAKNLLLLMCSLFALLPLELNAVAEEGNLLKRSAKIKAAVFFQITRFLDLQSKAAQPDSIVFCFSSNSLVSNELESLIRGRQVNGKKLQGLRFPDLNHCEDLNNSCDILFIDIIAQDKSERCISKTTTPALCNVTTLSWQGCMGQVFEEDNHARIAIDTTIAKKMSVMVSSDLLSLAILNKPEKPERIRQP